MAERKVKCYGEDCEKINKKWYKWQLIETKSNKRYCEACFDKLQKIKQHRSMLYHFIEEHNGVTFPTGQMLRQIKTLREKHNYTYFGILKSLEYMRDELHKSLKNDTFLYYVPYIYEDAKQWYVECLTKQKERERSVESYHKKPIEKITINYKIEKQKPKGLVDAEGLLD